MSANDTKRVKSLNDFPITRKWPAKHSELLQVYSFGTPNGVKATIALEELDLPYELHRIGLGDENVRSEEFLSLNPNNKIPAIIDPDGPDDEPLGLFESGAILAYFGDKTGKLMGNSQAERYEILQWLFFQVGGIGPMFGQFGYFHKLAGKEIDDPRPRQRYLDETKRLLGVTERALNGRDWIAGDYSVADIAIGPWLQALIGFYEARDVSNFDSFKRTADYVQRFSERPSVKKGWGVFEA